MAVVVLDRPAVSVGLRDLVEIDGVDLLANRLPLVFVPLRIPVLTSSPKDRPTSSNSARVSTASAFRLKAIQRAMLHAPGVGRNAPAYHDLTPLRGAGISKATRP
jgi:hypothetical protein